MSGQVIIINLKKRFAKIKAATKIMAATKIKATNSRPPPRPELFNCERGQASAFVSGDKNYRPKADGLTKHPIDTKNGT
jgi:hypothetical protein